MMRLFALVSFVVCVLESISTGFISFEPLVMGIVFLYIDLLDTDITLFKAELQEMKDALESIRD